MANSQVAADPQAALPRTPMSGGAPSAGDESGMPRPGDVEAEAKMRFNMRRYRPLGVSDIFDEAFDLYKSNFRLMLVATALVYVPLYIILIIFFNPIVKQLGQMAQMSSDIDSFFDFFGRTLYDAAIASVVYSCAMVLSTGAVCYVVSQRYLNRDVTILEAYSLAGRRLFSLCLSVFLATMLACAGFILCGILAGISADPFIAIVLPFGILLALWLCCRYCILPQVVIVEGLGPFAAIGRCWRMTAGSYWRLGMVMTMLLIVKFVLTEAISAPIGIIEQYAVEHSLPLLSSLSSDAQRILDAIAQCIVGLLVAPFGYAVMTIAYYDIRIRDEGYDMAILNELLGYGRADQRAWIPKSDAKKR